MSTAFSPADQRLLLSDVRNQTDETSIIRAFRAWVGRVVAAT